jgi:glycosyltransferase involved in cell wall biosynthesis
MVGVFVRILMISKALVTGVYQRKLEELAALPGVELMAVVPPYWYEARVGVQRFERAYTSGYQMVEYPMWFNGRHHIHFYPGIGRIIRSFKPDVLHIDEEPYNFVTLHAAILGRMAGAKVMFFSWQNLYRRYPIPFRMIELSNYRLCAAGVAGNREAVEVLRRKGYRGPLDVIPQFGVDPEIYSPPEYRPKNDKPIIGYAGRLVYEKGVDVLIEAVSRLKSRAPRLHIIGDGSERGRLEHLAAYRGIRDRVTFRGQVAPGDMPNALRALDVLVIPSRTRPNWKEQFGRIIVEAMACGVPVLGSNSGEIPNVIGNPDLVFPEDNVDALTRKLDQLLEDYELRQQLSEWARQRVLDYFTQASVARRYYNVYRMMLEGPVRPRNERATNQ